MSNELTQENMGKLADELYELREKRWAIGREIKAIEEREREIKEFIISNLSKLNAGGISGSFANVSIKTTAVPKIDDWDKFFAYVESNKDFSLMQKRINTTAIKERIEDNADFLQEIGASLFNNVDVSITKVK